MSSQGICLLFCSVILHIDKRMKCKASALMSVSYIKLLFQISLCNIKFEETIKCKTVVTPIKDHAAVYYTCIGGQCTM